MTTIFNELYNFITLYILPLDVNIPYWEYILSGITVIATLGVFWSCFCRPFVWLFKYGVFGNSKKRKQFNTNFD